MFNRSYFLIAAALMLLANMCPCSAQESTQAPPKSEARETWRKSMINTELPGKGCFTVSYPDAAWHQIPCSTAKPVPPQPPARGKRGGGGTPLVGGGGTADFSATTANLYNLAEGTFNSVTPGVSEAANALPGTAGAVADSFSLQINTNTFTNATTTGLCTGAAVPALCQGWVQFVFQNDLGAGTCGSCVSVWYWLLPYGAACPAGWTADVGDCFISSALAPIPAVTISSLSTMTLTGKISGGNDVTILDNNNALTASVSDNTLDLAASWNTTEFNVFGGGGGNEAFFDQPSGASPGTTIVVKTTVDDGTTAAPTCTNASFTGETNNLNLGTCCPYGGATPNIQFMETNAGHTATCGATQLLGDPHITTADGTLYNFQGAGEFVSLRDTDGSEIQTRQRPVSTNFIGTDGYDGLTTCVSLNSAVAARVAGHRVTWEPNLSGVPDPSGLQLRIDGNLTSLGSSGLALGSGGRVVPQAGGALEVDFPDGKTLLATPEWWASQSEWYLNVNINNVGLVSQDTATSGLGIAGSIASGSWLPALPGGASVGPMPGGLPARYDTLYHKFGDAWRVNDKDTLFDYAPGKSTATFTDRDWPSQKSPCVYHDEKPLQPASIEVAQAACRRVGDLGMRADCVFDVQATGDILFAKTYLTTQRLLADSTTTSLLDDADPSQLGEWVTFTAVVTANSATVKGIPSGTVQFFVDGMPADGPVTLNARGRANWSTSQLKVGKHKVTATYTPAMESMFLPSTSLEKLQTVRRCPCEEEHERKGQ